MIQLWLMRTLKVGVCHVVIPGKKSFVWFLAAYVPCSLLVAFCGGVQASRWKNILDTCKSSLK